MDRLQLGKAGWHWGAACEPAAAAAAPRRYRRGLKQATLFLYLQKVTVSLGSWPPYLTSQAGEPGWP